MQQGRVRKEDPINRVKCVVDTCEYYTNGDRCTAQAIEIQPPGAQEISTTDCATFHPKQGHY